MKRKSYILIASLVLLILSGFQVIEDPDFIVALKEKLREYNRQFPEEKIYLQFDKPFYKPGEDIWFNAFVINSNSHKPSLISDVLYVELIDPKGNVASRLELVINEGTAYGDFPLAPIAPGGLYKVYAYTKWMKNFGEENKFEKTIQVQRVITPRLLMKLDFKKEAYGAGDNVTAKFTIKNLKNEKVEHASIAFSVNISGKTVYKSNTSTDANGQADLRFTLPDDLHTTDGLLTASVEAAGVHESISRSVPIVLNKISISFFPEGGHWIEGAESRIAFKALNEFGKGADVEGIIVDEQNQVLSTFESFHMGMGAFTITPRTGQKYYAKILKPVGNEISKPLPIPLVAGLTLSLKEESDDATKWRMFSTVSTTGYLVARLHGEIVYSEKINLSKGENLLRVPSTNFSSGIAVFTLFDSNGIERSERLAFVNGDKGLNIRISSDKGKYHPGENVALDIETVDDSGKPVPAKISLSVADDQLIAFADDRQDNIVSQFLLSSEVNGEVQEPAFYFDKSETKARRALDFLLMTQGWRRFTWQDVSAPDKIITYIPEKARNVSGVIVNSRREPVAGDVTLLELGHRKRIVTVKTTTDGLFSFKNLDPTVPVLLLTKKPAEIALQDVRAFSISFNDKAGTIWTPEVKEELVGSTVSGPLKPKNDDESIDQSMDFSLDSDVTSLEEVIVVGYGIENKSALTGSVVTIREDVDLATAAGVESAINGRVAGVIINPQAGNPASQYNIRVRGNSSMGSGRSEPLYVIDGHPIGTSINQNFSNGSMVGPEDIHSIEIIHSPEASALYGSAAANGVIMITTKSRLGYSNFRSTRKPAKYSSLTIQPRKFSAVRQFYTAPVRIGNMSERNDFRTTVYWNHTIITDKAGKARVKFSNNDAVSAFRVTAEGISGTGLIGRTEFVYNTLLPVSIDTRIPEYLGFEDTLRLPVSVKNETSSAITGSLTLDVAEGLLVREPLSAVFTMPAGTSKELWFTISSKGLEGDFPVSIKLKSSEYNDELKQVIHVQPVGFPVSVSHSGKNSGKPFRFTIDHAERGSLKATLTAFPDVLGDLFTGAEGILREPHGCFEQVSSSNFPNVLALQFLKQSGMINPAVEKHAVQLIDIGYERLTAYEIKGGGFDWFGRPPAHEGLTAYGLIQFHEMKKVYSGVDENMLSRTREWLLRRRNNKGGFDQHAGMYGFSAASRDVNNAFLVYALAETGTTGIEKEYDMAFFESMKSRDYYRMALMANASYALGKIENYNVLIDAFKEQVAGGFSGMKMDHSIVRSYGNSLLTETIALWSIALMKSADMDFTLTRKCIDEILKARTGGHFGSTQATAMALKALTDYASRVRTTREDGEIRVMVGGEMADKLDYKKQTRDKLVMNNFIKALTLNGEQLINIHFDKTTEPLPYSLHVEWHSRKPQSDNACKVQISTSLGSAVVRRNETVRLTVNLSNRTDQGLPMTMAVIGLPAGLSVQPWQLKEMQEKKVFDFYETSGGKLVLYYRQMDPNGTRTINLDLKADVPGTYTGAASVAYLYYTSEHKNWVEGNSITVE